MPVHSLDVLCAKKFGQEPACWRRFRVDLDALPLDDKVELLLQFFDDALADKAERSDIIGEYLQLDSHILIIPLLVGCESNSIQKRNNVNCLTRMARMDELHEEMQSSPIPYS